MSSTQKPTCFVIAPIGEPGSDTRKRSDKVLLHVFEKALNEEYKVTRADKISEPGMITSQILRALQDSDLVIADLSEHNANVFYELAVRHAAEKPVIHVIDSRWKIPFDVSGFRTIVFDFTDLDSVADAIKQLKQQAGEISSGKQGETPIKLANILRRSNADSEDTLLLKEAVQGISRLHADVSELASVVASQLARSESAAITTFYSPAASGSVASPLILTTKPHGFGSGGYGIGGFGSEVFQPPIVPAGNSETLVAQTLAKQASQPEEVPSPKKPKEPAAKK